MSDTEYQEEQITIEDVERSIVKRYCWKPSRVVFSANREDAFVLLGSAWQRMDLTDAWHPHDPVPGYIPAEEIELFYRWLDAERDRSERRGRKIGENAMGAAIRGLIGAASLVDLERVERGIDPQD